MNVPGFEKEVSEFLEYVYHATIGSGDSLEIPGTRENLQNAIKQYGKNILQFHFNEYFQNYTPLEYAIKIGDPEAVRAILSFGSDLHSPQVKGSIAYFYLFQLSTNPQLAEKFKDFPELLEFAVKKMFQNKKIDWEIIDILLPMGLKMDHAGNSTIFVMFRNCDSAREEWDFNGPAIVPHITNLQAYLKMEKSVYNNSTSGLTAADFQTCLAEVTKFKLESVGFSISAETDALSSTKDMKALSEESRDVAEESKSDDKADIICHFMRDCLVWFEDLVKEGNFKDCFQPEEVNLFIQALAIKKKGEYSDFVEQLAERAGLNSGHS